jgi:hypothetical protein
MDRQIPRDSRADQHWALADQYMNLASDPTETPEAREYAQREYERNMRIAQQIEAGDGSAA